MVRLYEKVEKLPRIFGASVVVSKYLDDGCYRLKKRMEKLKINYCTAPPPNASHSA